MRRKKKRKSNIITDCYYSRILLLLSQCNCGKRVEREVSLGTESVASWVSWLWLIEAGCLGFEMKREIPSIPRKIPS